MLGLGSFFSIAESSFLLRPLRKCGLWSQIVEQDLHMLQRALVFLGNANNLFCDRRRVRILEAIDPNLSKYAKGDLPDVGKHLYLPTYEKEIVSQVEADTALTKAAKLISKASSDRGDPKRKYPQGRTFKPKSPLFRSGRMASYGGASNRPVFNSYGQRSQPPRGRGKYQSPRAPNSIFSRLGPATTSYTQSSQEDIQTHHRQK